MNMETKKQIFERYKDEYYKARIEKKGGRKRCGEILDIVCDVAKMARKATVRIPCLSSRTTAYQMKQVTVKNRMRK